MISYFIHDLYIQVPVPGSLSLLLPFRFRVQNLYRYIQVPVPGSLLLSLSPPFRLRFQMVRICFYYYSNLTNLSFFSSFPNEFQFQSSFHPIIYFHPIIRFHPTIQFQFGIRFQLQVRILMQNSTLPISF